MKARLATGVVTTGTAGPQGGDTELEGVEAFSAHNSTRLLAMERRVAP